MTEETNTDFDFSLSVSARGDSTSIDAMWKDGDKKPLKVGATITGDFDFITKLFPFDADTLHKMLAGAMEGINMPRMGVVEPVKPELPPGAYWSEANGRYLLPWEDEWDEDYLVSIMLTDYERAFDEDADWEVLRDRVRDEVGIDADPSDHDHLVRLWVRHVAEESRKMYGSPL